MTAIPATLTATVRHDTFDRAVLLRELERDERFLPRVYLDTAVPPRRTAGIGRNLDNVGIRPAETHALGITVDSIVRDGITRPQALYLCNCDVAVACHALDAHLPWWRALDPIRQRVMLNWCFNIGIGGLLGFKNTLAAIERHDWPAAVAGMKASKWNTQVGHRAERLEQAMATGVAVPV